MTVSEPDKAALEIHLNKLEVDCQELPQQIYHWGVELAKASKRVKELKNSLKLNYADTASHIRRNPAAYGLDKITEGAIDQCVLRDSTYQHIQNQVIEAEYDEDVLEAFVKGGLADKKSELENMVKLHGQMYWSKPVTHEQPPSPQRREETMRQSAKGIKSEVKDKLKKPKSKVDYYPED